MNGYPKPRIAYPPLRPRTTQRFAANLRRWQVIAQLTREEGWACGVEVGTADGTCTVGVLSACPQLILATIDPWTAQPANTGPEDWADWPHARHETTARARLAPYANRCTIIKGYSVPVAATFDDEMLDFVFLDGDHGEAAVRADIAAWAPKIRPGGALLGHDASWPGVAAAIDALCPGYWVGPDDVWGVAC